MNNKLEHAARSGSGTDIAMYVVAVLLAAAGVFVFYWFGQWPGWLRGLIVFAGFAVAAGVFLLTGRGHSLREFLSESRFELRKVVWPTLNDARRTTLVVLVVVVVVSLLLAGLDGVIRWLVKLLLGH
jgi:preprotein translocase subunit SecE